MNQVALDSLPVSVQNYIQDIIKFGNSNIITITSIVLFGSILRNDYQADVSDVDILVIVEDKTQLSTIQKLSAHLQYLVKKYNVNQREKSQLDTIFKIVEYSTGMFIPQFICREKEITNIKFNKIFGVNPILSLILAPKSIVWNNVVRNATTVYGKELITGRLVKPIQPLDIVKSLIMTSLLNLWSILSFKLHPNSTKYSLEAVKWTLYTNFILMQGNWTTLQEIIDYYSSQLQSKSATRMLTKFVALREHYSKSYLFIIRAQALILHIHLYSMRSLYRIK